MPTKHLSDNALAVLDSYEHLKIGEKKINTPYFNNRTSNLRGALRVLIGKGTAQEIIDETRIIALRDKLELENFDEIELVKFLTDHKLGIDCSGFVYYILDAELKTQGKRLKHILSFTSKKILRRLIARIRNVENTNVLTLHENSIELPLEQCAPGDMIISLRGGPQHDYSHVILITSVTTDESGKPLSLEYAHSYHWKSEGLYTKGIRKGVITIIDTTQTILEQTWTENGKNGEHNETWQYLRESQHCCVCRIKT